MSTAYPDYARADGDSRSSWENLSWIDQRNGTAFAKPRHPSHDVIVESLVISIAVENTILPQEEQKQSDDVGRSYPQWLITMFAGGLVVAVIGVVLLIVTAFAKIKLADTAGGIFAAVGAVLVALAILR